MNYRTKDEIRQWIGDEKAWPTADSYDLDTLQPCALLGHRERIVKEFAPWWFVEGEEGAALLSVGTGKGYFERKLWRKFARIYSVDPSTETQLSLQHFPVANLDAVARSLFDVPYRRLELTPKYAWLGACSHYLFAEFDGWEFMRKVAMMVSDTVLIDGGVFDADTVTGRHLMGQWTGVEPFDQRRREQFSYECFRRRIEGLWEVEAECSSPWTEGRRSMILKRILPPKIQKAELDLAGPVIKDRNITSSAFRTSRGYFKATTNIGSLLVYHTVATVMGWDDMLVATVSDGERFCGFVVKDFGDTLPDATMPSASETMHLALMGWLLPLGLLPVDVARENIRIRESAEPVWIDIDLVGLRELDARGASWLVGNIYKEYRYVPSYVRAAFASAPSSSAQ